MNEDRRDRMATPLTRIELAEQDVEREQKRHKLVEKQHKSGEQFIESRLKVEKALDRLEQAKKLDSPAHGTAPEPIRNCEPRKSACPYCGSQKSSVYRTVGTSRYRNCGGCGRSFATIEQVKK